MKLQLKIFKKEVLKTTNSTEEDINNTKALEESNKVKKSVDTKNIDSLKKEG